MKKSLSLIPIAVFIMGLLGSCKTEEPIVSVTGVSLDKTTLAMTIGDSEKLTATVAPENANDKTISWSSDKPEIATVDQGGNVTAVAEGTANITVTTTDGGKKATCTVTVKAAVVPVSGVTLDKTELAMTVGDEDITLTATVAPEDATDKTVSWASDKTEIATVDQEGKVHAVAEGTANITVTTTDGGKTDTCVVTVKAAVVPVSGVTLDKTELTMTVGDEDITLTAAVAPEDATDKTVSWASDKPEIATVDQEGKVHAVAEGTATITVTTTDGGKTATCVVKVKAAVVPVSSVALDKTELTLTVGDPDVKLVATVAPENATDKTVSWASDKTDIATVDQEGNVHAVTAGTANITVTTTDGGKTATCAVKVKAALPANALPGEFSVSTTKKVLFSKGNLVATINDSGAPTAWKFATNQYDYIGEGGANKAIGVAAGDVDLFGWSTASTTYGISTFTSSSSYSGDFVDWGKAYCEKNNITPDNTWRTLSEDEWVYLFNNHTKKWASVNGKSGYVIAPDGFTGELASSYADDAALASAGNLVFLPAAGLRYGFFVDDVGDSGFYWSSTASDGDGAWPVAFDSDDVYPDDNVYREYGFSVRLITECQ